MFAKFKTKELIFLTFVGIVLFIVDLLISIAAAAITGNPASGWVVNSIFWFAIAVIGAVNVKKFGSATLMAFIYGVLSAPTALMGPPGIYKIILSLVVGLVVDSIAFLFRYKNAGYYVGCAVANILSVLGLMFSLTLLGLPGVEEMRGALVFMLVILSIESIIGAWLGIKIQNKIKNKKIIKQFGD